MLTKNRSFVEDFSKWIGILGDAPETYLYRNAAKVYQEAFANMLMGLYQPAFMGLRYFLERTLTGVFYSGNELELRTWLRGERDTYWVELIGRESNGIKNQNEEKDKNVDSGLFSLKFTRAFFPEIADSAKTFRSLTSKVYRNCSEFVHGNPGAIDEIGPKNDFSQTVAEKWNEYADTIIRCILYAFMMRYWNFLPETSKKMVRTRIEEEFSTTDILKTLYKTMDELYLRTEDIDDSDILNLCIENEQDRETINLLKSRTPVILEGSRGVGKSFLMRVAAQELKESFAEERVLPVYITFIKSSLVAVRQKGTFLYWMLSNICSKIIRQLRRNGIIIDSSTSIDILAGGKFNERDVPKIEIIKDAFEESWSHSEKIDIESIPTVEKLKDAVEEICEENDIKRIVLFIDEAAHNFIREQQAEFFTLFRYLRCSKISCKAAVYPGVTAYGNSFQFSQDATFIKLNRLVQDDGYVDFMKNMVLKQISDSTYSKELSRRGQIFTDLTFAASGNPRFLLNNIRSLTKFGTNEVNQCIKGFYRDIVLRDHTMLSTKYPRLRELIDWGRSFIEDTLLPELQKRNQEALKEGKATTAFFWIHKDAPEPVIRAISLLEYSGIVIELNKGHKGTGREIGTRYMVNLGCLFAVEANPLSVSHQIIDGLSVRKFIEYGVNSPIYNGIKDNLAAIQDNDMEESMANKLGQGIDVLDLSPNMKEKLRKINMNTIKDVLEAPENKLKEAHYVGDIRARRMKYP